MRMTTEISYRDCDLDDVKDAICKGAMPYAYVTNNDEGRAIWKCGSHLFMKQVNDDGSTTEVSYYYSHNPDERDRIETYIMCDYEGGFHV